MGLMRRPFFKVKLFANLTMTITSVIESRKRKDRRAVKNQKPASKSRISSPLLYRRYFGGIRSGSDCAITISAANPRGIIADENGG